MLILSHYDRFILVFRIQAFQKRAGMLGVQCLKGQWGEVQDPTARGATLRNPRTQVGMQAATCARLSFAKSQDERSP